MQAAAENYFRKNVEELSLAEAALLAGLPQAPSRYSPFAPPRGGQGAPALRAAAHARGGHHHRRGAERAPTRRPRSRSGRRRLFRETAPFYVEQVRRQVVERYGNDRLLNDGLRVEMAMDLEKQRAAQAAMLKGLLEVDHRQGFYGPVARVEPAAGQALQARLERVWPAGALAVGRLRRRAMVTQVGRRGRPRSRWAGRRAPAHRRHALGPQAQPRGTGTGALMVERVSAALRGRRRGAGPPGGAATSSALGEAERSGHGPRSRRRRSCSRWSRSRSCRGRSSPSTRQRLRGGHGGRLRLRGLRVQPRLPGLPAARPAFKPIVYSAAIEKLGLTPATILTDAPMVFRDDRGLLEAQELRRGLQGRRDLADRAVNSMNIPAVKTAEALAAKLGPGSWGSGRPRLGLTTPVKQELGSALGCSCVTLWELTERLRHPSPGSARSGRPSWCGGSWTARGALLGGPHAPARSLGAALERLGRGSPRSTRPRERALDERTAYVLVHLHAGGGHRGHRGPGRPARQAGRRQDRHHQRLLRHLVHGLHPRPRHRGLARATTTTSSRSAAPRPAAGPRSPSGSTT